MFFSTITPDPYQWWCRFEVIKQLVCLAHNVITYPTSAFNTFLAFLIDIGVAGFPSTPEHFKIANMLASFSAQFPQIGWGIIFEIFNGLFIMLAIYLSVKSLKLLPFT